MLRAALIALILLALPASAQAAERFVGLLENGQLVTFTSQEPYGLSRPMRLRGLIPGERIVALTVGLHGQLVGVGTSARLYAINRSRGLARPLGPPFPQGLRGTRFSLAAAPGAPRGRLLSDVGQDLIVNLATGETEPGPGLRRAGDGAPVRPTADAAPDGRLVGVQLGPESLLRETAPGASTLTTTRLQLPPPPGTPRFGEPIAFQLGSDGRGYVVAVLSDRRRFRQSTLFTLDPATGKLDTVNDRYLRLRFFGRRLTTFASLGHVPDDRTAPRVRVSVRSRVSVAGLLRGLLPVRVRVSEGGFMTIRVRVGGRFVGNGFGTRDTPGTVPVREFSVNGKDRRADLRRAVGKRARLHVYFSDRKGNRRRVDRTVRLTR